MVASGRALLASPGSSSLAYWARASLNREEPKMEEREAFRVFVFTRLLPVCSAALVGPPFSKFTPVNSCWL
jgi:hypothetical protein